MSVDRIYLAGPIAGTTDAQMNDWRRAAAAMLAPAEVLDPAERDFRHAEMTDEVVRTIVEGDLADIDTCGVLLANVWQIGVGTSMELIYAHRTGVPTVVVVPELRGVSPWIRYHATVLTTDLAEACARVVDLLAAR